jgi:hypothetical protein
MSYRSVAANFIHASRQTKEFHVILANGREGRIAGANLADAKREAERWAKFNKSTIVSLKEPQ